MIRSARSTTSRRIIQRGAAAFCAVLSAVGGCPTGSEHGQSPAERTDATAVSRTASNGPVSLTLTASPGEIDFAADQRVEVVFEVLAQAGVTVDVDPYERALRASDRRFEYRVVRSDKGLAEPTADGRLRWTYRYELEFFLPGECELPAASVSFVDLRGAEDGEPRASALADAAPAQTRVSLSTEPLTIVVRAPANEALLQEEELRRIPPLSPIELPDAWSRYWWMAPLILLVLAVAAVLTIRRLRARREERMVVIPPHEWALRLIAALIAEDLLGKGLIQEFYYRISDIVRGYVERRFAVSAPEMTTEEFLAVVVSDRRFAAPHDEAKAIAAPLQRFLTACDLVKYARHAPAATECDAVLEAAGSFIEHTREDRVGDDGLSG